MTAIYYVYEHTRPDTGNVFYVGKGSFKRAYSKAKRNKHWHNIVNKAQGFSVNIIAKDLDNIKQANFIPTKDGLVML